MMSAIETADIFRGAYLLCCGARVCNTHVTRHQVLFVIEGEGVAELDERYRLGTALVNPVQLEQQRGRFPISGPMNKRRNYG